MKVPVLDPTLSAPRGELFNSAGPNLVKADTQVAKAVGELGQDVGQFGSALGQHLARAEAAQKQALGISVAEGLTAFERQGVRHLEGDSAEGVAGYFQTQGKAAHAEAGAALSSLEKARAEVENTIPMAARAEYSQRSKAMLVDMQRRVEQHAGRQFAVARKQALDGLQGSALGRIATSDPQSAWQAMADVERSIEQVVPEGEREQALAEWRQKAAVESVKRDLSDENPEAARSKLETFRPTLGILYDDVKSIVDGAMKTKQKAADIETTDVEGEKAAMGIIAQALVPETRWVDRGVAEDLLDKMPPGKVKDEASRRLQQRLAQKEREKTQAVDTHYNAALATYRKTRDLGAVDPKVRAFLQDPKNDPEAWEKLENMRERDLDRMRRLDREHRGDTRDKRAAKSEQKSRDSEVLNLYVTELLDGRLETDPAKFAEEHGGVSDEGASKLVRKQAEYRAKTKSGEVEDLSKWRTKSQEIARRDSIDPKTKKPRYDEQARADLQAGLFDMYERKQSALGRRLTPEEEQAIESEALLKMETRKRTGWGFGRSEVLPKGAIDKRERDKFKLAPGAEKPPTPPQKSRAPVKVQVLKGPDGKLYRLLPDGTMQLKE